MPLTLLLDLDDTLLNTNLSAFIPAYFQALAKNLSPHIAPELMTRALLVGTNQMNTSEDFSNTLSDVFDASFYPLLNISRGELAPAIENFYDNIFPTLKGLTTQRPDAKPFVDWAFSKGYRLVVATDPLLPRKATYHRLRWAGFDPEQFEIVTTYEDFHFSKTHAAYYAEVLGRLGRGPSNELIRLEIDWAHPECSISLPNMAPNKNNGKYFARNFPSAGMKICVYAASNGTSPLSVTASIAIAGARMITLTP